MFNLINPFCGPLFCYSYRGHHLVSQHIFESTFLSLVLSNLLSPFYTLVTLEQQSGHLHLARFANFFTYQLNNFSLIWLQYRCKFNPSFIFEGHSFSMHVHYVFLFCCAQCCLLGTPLLPTSRICRPYWSLFLSFQGIYLQQTS